MCRATIVRSYFVASDRPPLWRMTAVPFSTEIGIGLAPILRSITTMELRVEGMVCRGVGVDWHRQRDDRRAQTKAGGPSET